MNMNTRYVTTRTAWAAPALASLQRRGAVTSVKRGLLIKEQTAGGHCVASN